MVHEDLDLGSDLFAIVGVSQDATPADIKKAFHRKARRVHPDSNPEPEAAREFRRLVAAYETLSDGLKETLEPLIGVFRSDKKRVSDTRANRVADAPKEDVKVPKVAEHPIVRVHPETGRKCLYVSLAHTTNFKGWSEAESQPLLDYLFEHQVQPEFTCRFRWEPGSIALWDNRCALHNPINDYHGHKRVLHRITFAGDAPTSEQATRSAAA